MSLHNMKKTETTKTTTLVRVAGVLIAVFLLLGLLSGCSSGSKSSRTAPTNNFNENISLVQEGGNLEVLPLNKIVEMLVSVYADADYNAEKPAKFDVQDYLIAASRGYDMLAEGFDDNAADPEKEGTADKIASALKVIETANALAAGDKVIVRSTYEDLNETDLANIIACFQTTVDTSGSSGGLDVILIGIGKALGWITTYLGFGSYLVGICIFAVLIEILLIPLAIRQQKNSIRQAKLRPKEMAIRKKYAGRTDQKTQQEVTREIQELYQRENFSPYSGCLPLLLQLPILMALYQIVINPLHYVLGQSSALSTALTNIFTASRAAGGLGQSAPSGTIQLLSKGQDLFNEDIVSKFAYYTNGSAIWESYNTVRGNIPNFSLFGLDLGQTPGFHEPWVLILIPVLTFVVYFFSMRLNRKFTYQPTQAGASDRQTACSNNMMDVSMPLMSTFFTFVVPGIIGVYWIFRSLLGVLKQFIMSKVMPLPVFTEEDYKAAAREMAGKRPKVQKSENAGKVRSLHHIDDEDFDDTREAALARKAAIAEREQREQEERAKKAPVEGATLKTDDRERKKKAQKEEQRPDEKPQDTNNETEGEDV